MLGLELRDADIPQLAVSAGVDASEFRRLLRVLKANVPMDVLEHPDRVWEIVYGPLLLQPQAQGRGRASRGPGDAKIGGIQPFTMPGWDHYSTWGYAQRSPSTR